MRVITWRDVAILLTSIALTYGAVLPAVAGGMPEQTCAQSSSGTAARLDGADVAGPHFEIFNEIRIGDSEEAALIHALRACEWSLSRRAAAGVAPICPFMALPAFCRRLEVGRFAGGCSAGKSKRVST